MSEDPKELLDRVATLSLPEQQTFSVEALRAIPIENTAEALKKYLAGRSPKERKEDTKKLRAALEPGPAGGPLSQVVRDRLWTTVVGAFSTVLIGSFLTLAIGVYVPAQGKVTPELVLSLFTSVVGFLAGVFVPSPVAHGQNNS
jgi:hypothetical protein